MDIDTARDYVAHCRRDFLAANVRHRAAADALDAAANRLQSANDALAELLTADG